MKAFSSGNHPVRARSTKATAVKVRADIIRLRIRKIAKDRPFLKYIFFIPYLPFS
jgi:hypothetical protein